MGPYQRIPKKVTRAIKYPGLGVRSVGPVGDFLEKKIPRIGRQAIDVPNFDWCLVGLKFQGLPRPRPKKRRKIIGQARGIFQGTNAPWKINMKHNDGGLDDHFPF